MDQRNELLYQIETDIKEKLTKVNGYNFTPAVVKRGIHSWNDFQIKPAICFTFIDEKPYESGNYQKTYSNIDTKEIRLMFYGYNDSEYGNSDMIFTMAADMETFLKSSDMTENEDMIVNGLEIKEAGSSDPINSFLMDVSLIYNYKDLT